MKKLPEVGSTVWFLDGNIRKGVVDQLDPMFPREARVSGRWRWATDVFATRDAAVRHVAKCKDASARHEYNARARAEEVAIRNVKRATDARQKAGAAWEKAKAALAATKGKV